ncbi:hypothetical protein ACL03H_04300 [Saccharopolyspora sp. MS10]|uniref:hypothetical protein n=1 Tax=Saccharopolyspora sp. MS10 TaxID=3385973 RepID=UPI0039A2A9EE
MDDVLVDRVRWLVDVQAPKDPDRAVAELDLLIARHGKASIAAALAVVAPAEMARLVRGTRC